MTDFEGDNSRGPSAFLFEGDKSDPSSVESLRCALAGSGVEAWVEERKSRFGEVVDVKKAYLLPDEDDDIHRVAWIAHKGVTEDFTGLVPYDTHHVTCDCALQASPSQPHPEEVLRCDTVQKVLEQRAWDLGKQHALHEMLDCYKALDMESFDFYLTEQGQELAMRALAYLMETDQKHPEAWMANKIHGLHHADNLSRFLNVAIEELMTILDRMETSNIIIIKGDTVRLM